MNRTFLLLFILCFSLSSLDSRAKTEDVLSINEITALIGPFPQLGSPEEALEDKVILHYQNTRTERDCELARLEEKTDFHVFFGKLLTPEEQISVEAIVARAYELYKANKNLAKDYYKRPRPFVRNPAIHPCVTPQSEFAYPSGHTTASRIWAQVLAKRFPERKWEFLKRADEIALNRIISGVHHPSDIEAGKKLGDEVVRKFIP